MDQNPNTTRRPVSLRRRLLSIALAGIFPLALVSAFVLANVVHNQQHAAERQALEITRLVATAVEVELNQSMTLLRVLAQVPALDEADLSNYAALVRRLLPAAPNWESVTVATPDGTLFFHLDVRDTGAPTIRRSQSLMGLRSFAATVETGEPQVGQLGEDPGGNRAVPLRMPVFRNGELKYVLNAILRPEAIHDVISTRELPPDWMTTVLDGNGLRLARTHQHAETFGKPPSPTLVEMLGRSPDQEGIGLTTTVEGDAAYSAFVRLNHGWIVATGIPTADVHAEALRAAALYGGGLLLSLLLGLVAALYATRRINVPMRELRAAALAIGDRQVPPAIDSEIIEIREVGQALANAAQGRLHSEGERDRVVARLEETREALTQQVLDLEHLQRLNHELLELPTLAQQLESVLAALCDFHDTSFGIAALRAADQPLEILAARGYSATSLAQMREAARAGTPPSQPAAMDDIDNPIRIALQPAMAREGLQAVHSTPVQSTSGRIIGALSVQLTTPRALTERELRLADLCAGLAAVFIERAMARAEAGVSEQRLHVALDSSTVPFCILSPVPAADDIHDFRCDFVNRTAALALQHEPETLVGRRVAHLLRGQLPEVLPLLADVVTTQSSREGELQGRRRQNNRWYHLIATPFENSVAVWFGDISERKRLERASQEADRRKDEFLATLAHELRNPLAPIRQAAAIIGSTRASEQQKRRGSDIIERQVKHMVLLLDDLLDISRVTLGRLELRKQSVQLQQIIAAAVEAAQPLLDAQNHELVVSVPAEPVVIQADPLRIEQIIINLLTNAAKYTNSGGRIELTVRPKEDSIEIAVRDSGIGIAASDMDLIFQIFTQLKNSHDRGPDGLGIGLALAKGLTILHGGEIRVESSGPGHGSCFTVRLPLGIPRVDDSPLPAAAAAPSTTRRVLIADDNRDIVETLAELLMLEGHEVCRTYSGLEALDRFHQFGPDIALLDIGMPGLRGEEVARAIRALPDGERVVLVAITGWGQASDKIATAAAGFDFHMTKPVDIDAILDIVASAPANQLA